MTRKGNRRFDDTRQIGVLESKGDKFESVFRKLTVADEGNRRAAKIEARGR
jgi:hypothetical protein